MRLLLRLKAESDGAFDIKYHHKYRGFIYSLLKGTFYEGLHDRKGYKYFCFSNLFPMKDWKNGEERSLLISSPNGSLLSVIREKLLLLKRVNLGDHNFSLSRITDIPTRIPSEVFSIENPTPIVLKVPSTNFGRYGIDSEEEFLYWTEKLPFEVFVKQLSENAVKKFKDYWGFLPEEVEANPATLFQQYLFKASTKVSVVRGEREGLVAGSFWRFDFSAGSLSPGKRRVLAFALDCGLGEMNPMGFGFVNVV